MTNILLEGYDINAPWLMDSLKPYVKPFHKAAIIFSVLSMFWYTFTRSFTKKGAVKKVPRQTNGSQAQKRAWESFVYVVQFNCHEKPYH